MWSALRFAICLLALCGNLFAPSVAAQLANSERTLTLVAVGDILLDRGVARQIERFGIDYPFAHVKSILTSADVAFGNLEGPLARKCSPAEKRFRFQAKPRYVQTLVNGGIDIVLLANNHSTDCGQTGLRETMNNLNRVGIRWCGAGDTSAEAGSVTVIEKNGIRIGFVGFSEFMPSYSRSNLNQAGIAFASEASVRSSVKEARRRVDIVIASFHWGAEYSSRPQEKEIGLARVAVEAGADLVLGHHPHVLQGLQTVLTKSGTVTRRSLVAYSLGNFIFDSPRGWNRRMNESTILRYTFSKNGLVSFEAIPVVIDGYRPRPGNEAESKSILTRLDELSSELNAKQLP